MKNTRVLALLLALIMVASMLGACGITQDKTEDTTAAVQKFSMTLCVTGKDAKTEEKEYTFEEGDKLSDVLYDNKLISKEDYDAGFFTTFDGVTADYDADQAWWKVLDGEGNMTSVGISDITLEDGDTYSIVYTIGY